MSIHEQIKAAREKKGWSMQDLADAVSRAEKLEKPLAWQTVQQWENGTSAPKRTRMDVVERLLGLKPWLDPEEFTHVRRVDVSFANGVGKVAYYEDDKPPLVFRSDFLRKLGVAEGNAVVVDAAGHSNVPKIPDGAAVLVNRGDRERLDGDFFAFRASGELLIKRLERLKGVGVIATAENPDFKPKTRVYADGTDDFEVIGRAVWAGARL